MRPEYQPYVYARFRQNLRALRLKVKEDKERAAFEMNALALDRSIHPISESAYPGAAYPRWTGSEAERKLKIAMDQGLDEEMMPQVLYDFDAAFQVFPLQVFRNHIYQERRSRVEGQYWADYWAARARNDEEEEGGEEE